MAESLQFSSSFQQMIDRPEELLRILESDPDDFERNLILSERNSHYAAAAIPNRSFLGFLLFDRSGQPIATREPGWLPRFSSFDELETAAEIRSGDGRLMRFTQSAHLALWAPYEETSGWNLPASLLGGRNP
ncbi:MAG: hypothetical protein NTX28_12765 [Novosphingobium sp.]|nr:hypothetical protein [Novosphingobium sp.]